MKPCVALCIPSMDTWKARTSMSVLALRRYSDARGIGGPDISMEGSAPSFARNGLVRGALSVSDDVTHLMWHDSDMTSPPETLVRLLSHDKDIVGAFGRRRVWPFDLVGELVEPLVYDGDLRLAKLMPGACVLVKRRVYEAIKTPWYFESYEGGTVTEDINFSRKASEYGFEQWCDMALTERLGHVGSFVIPGDLSQAEFLQPTLPS